jgi:hypothetical protein
MTINKCPYDYCSYSELKKRVTKWNKEHPENCKASMKKWGLRKRAEVAKNKIEKNLE